MKRVFLTLAVLTLTGPVLADDALWRDCRTCHQVAAPDGTVLARGGRAGPNLYGVAGRALAGDPGYRLYSADLQQAAKTGARWSEDSFVTYLANPDQFLRRITGNASAESGMHVQLGNGGAELYRWLRDLSQ